MERARVVVVGLGAMGSAAARALARKGVEPLALERFRVGHTRGSSHGATRIFRFSYPDADYVRMAQRALPLWRELEADAGMELLVTTGGLDAGPMATACADALGDCEAGREWVSRADAERRFPGLSTEGLDRVLFQPDAGVCLADRTVAAQVRLAQAAGVEVREDTEVLAVRPREDGVALDTREGPIEAEVAIVTAGAWVQGVLGGIPVTPSAQTVAYFPAADPAAAWPTFIEWSDRGFAWYEVPTAGDAPGVKVAEHRPANRVTPSDGPFQPDPDAVEATADYVRRRFPGLEPSPVAAETCLYEMTPDEHFVLDRIGPLVVGAGGSGHGFKFTPLVGELLAQLALGEETTVPLDRFSARRFDA